MLSPAKNEFEISDVPAVGTNAALEMTGPSARPTAALCTEVTTADWRREGS
jgi:hypothetical protein